MKYHFKANWLVVVDIEIKHEGIDYKFRFDFIVDTNESWLDILNTTKSIITEKFGHGGYKITQISLSNHD